MPMLSMFHEQAPHRTEKSFNILLTSCIHLYQLQTLFCGILLDFLQTHLSSEPKNTKGLPRDLKHHILSNEDVPTH